MQCAQALECRCRRSTNTKPSTESPPMLRLLLSGLFTMTLLGSATAQSSAPIDVLFRAMGIPELVVIMRQEGQIYGKELEQDLFPERGGARWAAIVDKIYDASRMEATVRNRFDSELAAEDLAPMIAFFTSERGQNIVGLEVSARRALLDESVEEASRTALATMIQDRDKRLDLIREFSDANELVETNVAGAMNANYAFYTGLATGGAFAEDMTEEDILADVWNQESGIRDDTEEWLYSYLALAYQPLADDDLNAYTAFSKTHPGTVLNRALFAAFDEMFVVVSLALGQGASQFLTGQEL